jgi:hypothetical protein
LPRRQKDLSHPYPTPETKADSRIKKINLKEVACFLGDKSTTQNTMISPRIHHNFTTIYHPKTHQDPQNPLQNYPFAPSNFFFRLNSKN